MTVVIRSVRALRNILTGMVICYVLIWLNIVDAPGGSSGSCEELCPTPPTSPSLFDAVFAAFKVILAALAIGIGIGLVLTIKQAIEEFLIKNTKIENDNISDSKK